jgi:hypothetical protein
MPIAATPIQTIPPISFVALINILVLKRHFLKYPLPIGKKPFLWHIIARKALILLNR